MSETFKRGASLDIKSLRDYIISVESKGQDASYERDLLKSWASYEGFEGAKEALKDCDKARQKR